MLSLNTENIEKVLKRALPKTVKPGKKSLLYSPRVSKHKDTLIKYFGVLTENVSWDGHYSPIEEDVSIESLDDFMEMHPGVKGWMKREGYTQYETEPVKGNFIPSYSHYEHNEKAGEILEKACQYILEKDLRDSLIALDYFTVYFDNSGEWTVVSGRDSRKLRFYNDYIMAVVKLSQAEFKRFLGRAKRNVKKNRMALADTVFTGNRLPSYLQLEKYLKL